MVNTSLKGVIVMSKDYAKPQFLVESLESDANLAAETISGDPTIPGYEPKEEDQGFGPWVPLNH